MEGERTDAAGLGLGLSIIRGIVQAHGAEVRAVPLPGGGLQFELTFSATDLVRETGEIERAPAAV